ncbi:MAG TPA: sulfotransferase [Rhizomicrobium sp.]|jgi:tetratricopeptide (TPR) repeat protein|nr:sulfotransferase [Rhizomicrobium sp.]
MEATVSPAPLSSTEAKVHRLWQLHDQGRHAEALDGARVLLDDFPQNRDLLLVEASSLRHMKRIDEALAVLERLERLQPRFSLMHQERGLCHVARKDAAGAIDALLRAVNINPALPMSWRMLEGVYRLTGETANAGTAAAHVATLKNLPPEVVTATSLFSDGELAPAEQIVRAFLLRYGDHPDAMRLLAKIGLARGVLDDAELLLAAALALAPDHRGARLDYAQALLERHKYREARTQAEQLLALDPANKDYLSLAATAAVGLGEHERAIALYRAMLADMPDNPDVHLWLGHALKTIDRLPEAIQAYRGAAAARPDFGDAYWSLANLKTYGFGDDEMARMRAAEEASATAVEDRIHLCFALGKALEDRGEIAQSWTCYERGNALKRAQSRYRPESIEANTARQIAVCMRAFFDQRAGWGDGRPDPIFILGLPRSGSTLLEQILASHSRVEGTQELADIQRVAVELMGRDNDPDNPRYPAVLAEMTAEDFRKLGEKYLDDTRVYRSGRPFFIDKMPNNFRHIGLIHLMLPQAKIIDARREPMSCCFSNLKQLFANGQEFSYSVDDIARYYRTYLELMRHWDEALPGRILRVQHEDVVADLEGSVRRILDYCGLDFEQACMDFHKTRRSVRTPSSEQVRRPIFRDGLDQWTRFEPWLDPLKAALGDTRFNYRL